MNRHLTKLFALLVFIATASTAYLLLPNKPPSTTEKKPLAQNIPWQNVATDTIITNNKTKEITPAESEQTPASSSAPIVASTTETYINDSIAATIEIAGQKYNLNLPEKSTAYDAMQKLIAEKTITATMKKFSGLGYFVEEINGLKNDNQTGQYWIYYLNGQSAKVGISSYTLKNNDLITWKYEKSQF